MTLALLVTALTLSAHPMLTPILGAKPTASQVELGRALFFDPLLSDDRTVSCATCHNPRLGWSDGRRVAAGVRGLLGERRTPTIINAAYAPLQFWDARAVGLANQSLQPIANPLEMGDQNLQDVLRRLRGARGYVAAFRQAYGPGEGGRSVIDQDRFGHALGSFEQTVTVSDAPVDRRLAGDRDVLSPVAERGFGVFNRAGCQRCHPAPHFTNFSIVNNGFEFQRITGNDDLGRETVTGDPRDRRAFKVASLREIQRRAPYGHHGQMRSLARIVRHYNTGGKAINGARDPLTDGRIQPLRLNTGEEDDLVAFLSEGFASYDYPYVDPPSVFPR